MSKRKTNSAYYKNQISKSSPYVQEMRKAVNLYDETKIEREDTLKKIFTLLKSRGEKNNQKGVELLNKYSNAEPAKGKIDRHDGPKRDNLLNLESTVRETALNQRVKHVDVVIKHMGSNTASNVKKVVVHAFNEALIK